MSKVTMALHDTDFSIFLGQYLNTMQDLHFTSEAEGSQLEQEKAAYQETQTKPRKVERSSH